ncbi:hypothetical protein OIO90_003569 [Microbotryomycetes sp. JL221]|nr:hypothetical protein OIO90_003569 [Microbotryomycetes sp. JL221]
MAPAFVGSTTSTESHHVNGHSNIPSKANGMSLQHTPPASPPHDLYMELPQVYTATGQWTSPPPTSATENPNGVDISSHGRDKGTLAPPMQFVAYNRSYPLRSEHEDFTWIQLQSEVVLKLARALYPSMSTLYDRQPGIDCRDLYVRRNEIKFRLAETTDTSDRQAIKALLDYVESKFTYVARQIAEYPPNTISWHLLWSLVTVGEDVESIHDNSGEPMALIVDSWAYVQESMGRAFVMKCHYLQWAGTTWHKVKITRKIMEYQDLRPIASLPTKPLTDDRRALLTERGQRYVRYTEHHHAKYEGFFFTRAFTGATKTVGDGQVIMDVKSYRRCNPSLDSWGDDLEQRSSPTLYHTSTATAQSAPTSFEPNQCYLLPPILHGFSLRAKRWGEFLVDRLSQITWADHSFEHLVIPSSYRRIIRSLVTVHAASDLKDKLMTDVVEGKGNGLIMALHGTPGTGKTLTAEAVAEHLQRPLYVVSAGELGVTAQALEKQLKDVLELATLWNAVLLIDEADIFLERRSSQQLERNALVGVFLRLLILTTNSIERFDEAFLSRFAVVLRFDELDAKSRKMLWKRFLSKASQDLSLFDLDRLASYKLNGRDIKHTVQTAQAVALCEKETLTMAHFEEVLSVAKSMMTLTRSNTH